MGIIEELEWRDLISDCTDREGLQERLAKGPITLYCGFDPTADSLHVGSLVPLLALRRFQLCGHHPIAVAGGATGSIGDPSGKTAERQLLTHELLKANIEGVKVQLGSFMEFEGVENAAQLVDNADWTAPLSFLDVLRDIGKHFKVNAMVSKESVRARMEDRDVGISYTEFSYMILQALDFHHLCETQDCELQIGGSDQWGNITAGIDLIHRKQNRQAYGLTLPLITNADGTKFGKTESGAVWLDVNRTSIYQFYQFWVRVDDRDVVRYLKYFTFLSRDEVEELASQHEAEPHARIAHKALAREVTALVHGEEAVTEAIRASEILFGGELEGITEATFREVAGEVPTCELSTDRFGGEGLWLPELLHEAGLAQSRGQARKDVKGGGVYVNGKRIDDEQHKLTASDLMFGKYVLLRRGKRNYAVVIAG
ncbi:MAG TPA: tyrosine--tRNA ligase [Verrucomicrobiales bacterium]|nr:tyrosine--tRNA ligase [Verrucomicrobiales bacterium]